MSIQTGRRMRSQNKLKYWALWLFIPLFAGMTPVYESVFQPRLEKQAITLPSIQSYPFLRMEHNEVLHPGSRERINRFYDKLDKLIYEGEGKVNVMHMGGSHVQAGTLSNRMRENLFSLAPGIKGERGFFFPFRMAHTNSPFNIKARYTGEWEGCRNAVNSADCRWGMSGVNATTKDSLSSFSVNCFDSDSVPYQFVAANIYHRMDIDQFCIVPDSSMDIKSIIRDSIGGFTRIEFFQPQDTLEVDLVKLSEQEEEFTLQGIKFEEEIHDGLSYQAVGVNGASVPSYLRCVDFTRHLSSNVPDLVIFGIGINDAYMPASQFSKEEFKQNYSVLMDSLESVNPDVAFLFLTNNDSYYKRRRANRNALEVQEGMYELAKERGAAIWDLFELMGGLNSVRNWEDAGLAKRDKIHFTRAGYILEADLLSYAIAVDLGRYLSEKYPSTLFK